MADFPLLKTGAAAQYPLHRNTRFQTSSVHFLDGSRQTYRLYSGGLRQWTIELEGLDDNELAMMMMFLETQGTIPFAYNDPATGQTVRRCVVAQYGFRIGSRGELQGDALLVIEEIP